MRSLSDRNCILTSLTARSPTAGGQYHWVSEFSPPWCQKYLSYITGMILSACYLQIFDCLVLKSDVGWILAIGWQGSVVGLSFAAGTIVRDISLSQLGRIRFSQGQQNDFLIPQLFESEKGC